jgi:hypothetical protein
MHYVFIGPPESGKSGIIADLITGKSGISRTCSENAQEYNDWANHNHYIELKNLSIYNYIRIIREYLVIFTAPKCKIFIIVRRTLPGKSWRTKHLSQSSVDFLDIISLILTRFRLHFNIIINHSYKKQESPELSNLNHVLDEVPIFHIRRLMDIEIEDGHMMYYPKFHNFIKNSNLTRPSPAPLSQRTL